MKKIIQFSLMLCGIVFTFSCGNELDSSQSANEENSPQKDMAYEEMAQDLCKCMTPLMEIQQKIVKLSAKGTVN